MWEKIILNSDFTFSLSLGSAWVWVATEEDDVAMKQGGFINIAWVESSSFSMKIVNNQVWEIHTYPFI